MVLTLLQSKYDKVIYTFLSTKKKKKNLRERKDPQSHCAMIPFRQVSECDAIQITKERHGSTHEVTGRGTVVSCGSIHTALTHNTEEQIVLFFFNCISSLSGSNVPTNKNSLVYLP